MSKATSLVPYIVQLPVRMYAPSAHYGLPYMLSADRRTLIVKHRTGYNFPSEIALLEDGIYDRKTERAPAAPSKL